MATSTMTALMAVGKRLWVCGLFFLVGCATAPWTPKFCDSCKGFSRTGYTYKTNCPRLSSDGKIRLTIAGEKGGVLGSGGVHAQLRQEGLALARFLVQWFENDHRVETIGGRTLVQTAMNTQRGPQLMELSFARRVAARGDTPARRFEYICRVQPQSSKLSTHKWSCSVHQAAILTGGRQGALRQCKISFVHAQG